VRARRDDLAAGPGSNCAANNRHPVLDGKALVVDGEFGDKTFAVVRRFQRTHTLQVDDRSAATPDGSSTPYVDPPGTKLICFAGG